MSHEVRVGDLLIGRGRPLALIAGPCVIESEDGCLDAAAGLKEIAREAGYSFIFKSSFDKANRTSHLSFRGPGLAEGLRILKLVKDKVAVPVLSDVHEVAQVEAAKEVLDVLQVPALLCRQTDLVTAVALSGRAVNLKKGQFLSPWEMENVVSKVTDAGNRNLMITERGTCFGYNNLVADMRSLPVLRELGWPVIFDATHSVQLPGGRGVVSGGDRRFVPFLARAAVAAGVDGVFLEVHPAPDAALSDGPNSLYLEDLKGLLLQMREIDEVVKRGEKSW